MNSNKEYYKLKGKRKTGNGGGNKSPSSSHINELDDASFAESFLKVSIFHEDLRFTHISEVPLMSFETLIGVIGKS